MIDAQSIHLPGGDLSRLINWRLLLQVRNAVTHRHILTISYACAVHVHEDLLFSHVNTAYTIFSISLLCNLVCLNGTRPCLDFMDVIMGGIPLQVWDALYVIKEVYWVECAFS